MRLRILHVPGCPSARVLAARLDLLLAGRSDVVVEQRAIRAEREAVRWGMTGSPTLLVDGVDPFGVPGRSPGISCRLYLDETGALTGSPSMAQLGRALASAQAGSAPRSVTRSRRP